MRKVFCKTLLLLVAVLAAGCGKSATAPSSTPQAAPVPRWMLSGVVTSSPAGGPLNGALLTIVDGPDAGRQATTDSLGRYALTDLQSAGFTVRASAKGYREMAKGITLTGNVQADFVLELPLGRLLDIGGSPIRYERVPGGFEMFATAINDGPGCVNSVAGVTTIKNAAPPNLTLDFPWSLPADRIIQPGETFEYRVGFTSDDQARQFPEGSASTKFSGFSIPCP